MKIKQYITGAVAALALFGFTTGSALAATQFVNTTKNLPSGVNMTSTDVSKDGNILGNASDGAVLLSLATSDVIKAGDVVTVDITGGTFAKAPVLAASTVAGVAVATPGFALLSGGTVGSTQAIFKAGVNYTPAANDQLRLTEAAGTGAGLIKMAGNTAGNALNIKTTITVASAIGSLPAYGTPLSQKNPNLKVVPFATLTAGNGNAGVVQVSDGFHLYSSGTGTTLVTVGTLPAGATGQDAIKSGAGLAYTANAASIAGQVTAGVPAAVPAVAKVLLTVSLAAGENLTGVKMISDGAAGTKIKASNASGSTTAVTGTNIGTANQFWIDAATNKAYAVLTAVGGVRLQIQSSQTAAMTTQTLNVTESYLGDANYSAQSIPGGGTEMTLTRNGSSFTSNSVGNLNKIKVTDRSGSLGTGAASADGKVTISAYNITGTLCSAVPAVTVPSNGSVTITGTSIQTACPGTQRVEGIVNSTAIVVSNIKNNPATGGITVNSAVSGSTATPGI